VAFEEDDEELSEWVRCKDCGEDRAERTEPSGLCWLCLKRRTPEYQREKAELASSDKRNTVVVVLVIAAVIGFFWMRGVQGANEERRYSRIGAVCSDGTSSEGTGAGACSGHDGVEEWIYEDTSYDTGDGSGIPGQP
jgi:hypothetical protein